MASDSTEPEAVATDAESAFKTLSHDLRLEILLALWDAPGFSLSFSDLRKTVDERDSGKFTYHLEQLQDHFVAKTDAGYELQYPGHRVLDAIQSGVYHEQVAVGPAELDDDCRTCEGTLCFEYDTDFIARVRCHDCGTRALEWPFDPGGIADRDSPAIASAFDRRTRLIWSCALDGICPFCAGRIDRDLTGRVHEDGACVGVIEQLDRYDEYFARDHPAVVAVDCDRCSFYSFIPPGVLLLTRPAVAGRLTEAGIDLRNRPLWSLGFVVDADAVTVTETDPMTVDITVPDAPEPLAFTVTPDINVTQTSSDT
jgi:hypothetical protein